MNGKIILLILCMGSAAIVMFSVNALTTNLTATEKLTTTIRTNSSVPSAYDSNGQISCNMGEILTGGGYKTTFKDGLSVYQNGPSIDGKKWLVSARYTPGSASGGTYYGKPPPLEIYGVCVKSLS